MPMEGQINSFIAKKVMSEATNSGESYRANVWGAEDAIANGQAGNLPLVHIKDFKKDNKIKATVFQTCIQSDNDGSGPNHNDKYHRTDLAYEGVEVDKDGKKKKVYFNADNIAYMVLPKENRTDVSLGDIGIVVNLKNGQMSYVIYADRGPSGRIGEASIKTLSNLGVNIEHGDNSLNFVYIMFPGSREKCGLKPGGKLPTYSQICDKASGYLGDFISQYKFL